MGEEMQKKQFTIIVFVVYFFISISQAAEYFVDPNGNDTTGSGTISAPYKTITKAYSVVSAGDTIYIRGGTHIYSTTITISKSGTSSAKYYLLAYNNERPVLNFSSMSENSSNRCINLKSNYWHIKGIDIYGAGDNGMNISGSYNTIEFCRFYENHDTGLQIGGGGAYNNILNCDSFYNADSSLENADGFAPKLDLGTGNYFYGCRAWQNLDDGYDGYLRGADNVTTTYENCWAFKNGYLKSGVSSGGDGNGFKMGGSDDKTLRHNIIMINCMSFSNAVKGFDQNSNKGNMTLYNCSAFANGTYNYSIGTTLASGCTATLTNCLYYSGSNSLGSFVVQTTNDWTTSISDFISVDPSAAYGPRKADGSLPDITFMHLAQTSSLIDAGTNVGLPYNGSAPDIGCFEYSEVTNPAPAAPTGLAADAADSLVVLDWNANTEEDLAGYNIYRSTTSGSGYTKLNSTLLTSPGYTDSTVENLATYYYAVTAVDAAGGESAKSTEASAMPTIYGDFIIDGSVVINDLAYLANVWLITDCAEPADLNGDCIINFYEFSAFANNWLITPPEPEPIPSITVQENTAGFCSVDGSIDNNNSGFTGTGFANTTNAAGKGVNWRVNILTAGSYTFTWRYASTSSRPGNLIINGSTVLSGISFPSTGAWTTWTTVTSSPVTLTAGVKTIRLESTSSDGLANIDYIQIDGVNLTTAACE